MFYYQNDNLFAAAMRIVFGGLVLLLFLLVKIHTLFLFFFLRCLSVDSTTKYSKQKRR